MSENPLPNSRELEMQCLSTFLFDEEQVFQAIGTLKPKHFYHADCRTAYECIITLAGRGSAIDTTMLTHELTKTGLEDHDSTMFVGDIVGHSSSWNLKQVAFELIALWQRRDLFRQSQKNATAAGDMTVDIVEILDAAESGYAELRADEGDDKLASPKSYTMEFLDDLESDHVSGIPSTIPELNHMIGGYEPGNCYWFGGAEKMGKSSWLLSEAHGIDIKNTSLVGIYFSLEMGTKLVTRRRVSMLTGIPITDLKRRTFPDSDWPRIHEALGKIRDGNLLIDYTSAITPELVRARCNRVIMQKGRLDYVFFDYFQKAGFSGNTINENEKHIKVSEGLRQIAKDFDIPVIGAAQVLSKAIDNRTDKSPNLSDIRGSSALQADGYMIGFIYRPGYYDPDGVEAGKENVSEIVVRAHRDGPTGTIEVLFRPEQAQFVPYASRTVDLNDSRNFRKVTPREISL